MTAITWKFQGKPEEITILNQATPIVLSDGSTVVTISQLKMFNYLTQIINNESRSMGGFSWQSV